MSVVRMALDVATVHRFLGRAVSHTHPRVWNYWVDVESLDVVFAAEQGSLVWDVADCEDAAVFDEPGSGGESIGVRTLVSLTLFHSFITNYRAIPIHVNVTKGAIIEINSLHLRDALGHARSDNQHRVSEIGPPK